MRKESQIRGGLTLGTQGVPSQPPILWLLVIIDTNTIKASFPNPSQEQANPTAIGANMGFMLAPGLEVNSGKRTEALSIYAQMGCTVRASATSGSDNFQDAVLLYDVARSSGTRVFSDFSYQGFTTSTVAPHSEEQPLPTQVMIGAAETFWFHHATVIGTGTEDYILKFALYTRDIKTGQPLLYGYFCREAEITVQGKDGEDDDHGSEKEEDEERTGR